MSSMQTKTFRTTMFLAIMFAAVLVLSSSSAAAGRGSETTISKYTIAGRYETDSQKAKVASLIDMDLKEMVQLMQDNGSDNPGDSFYRAKDIYEKGMHSGPYAKLTLKEKLSLEDARNIELKVHEHDNEKLYESITGRNSNNEPIKGKIQIPSTTSSRAIQDNGVDHIIVRYNNEDCSLGGNPEPNFKGCFVGPEGELVLEGYDDKGPIEYTNYDPIRDNRYESTLMSFSEDEAENMYEKCGNPKLLHKDCPFAEYNNYFKYYGKLDYGHHWIDSAFHQRKTDYSKTNTFLHGNENFSLYDNVELRIAISTAAVTLNVFTQINRLMVESAVGKCKEHVHDYTTYGQSSVRIVNEYIDAWDTAVAIFAGSMLIIDDENDENENDENNVFGTMYYGLVEEMAIEYGALDANTGKSVVNKKIMDEFITGRHALLNGDCDVANDSYYRIIHLMRVPLIQGVLSSSKVLDNGDDHDYGKYELAIGRGSAFLAALLPALSECSKESAMIVYEQMKVTSAEGSAINENVNSKIVHDEIYNQMECLRVDCTDIDPSHPSCDGFFDAESTTNAAATEHRYTSTNDPAFQPITKPAYVSSSSGSNKNNGGGGTYALYAFVAVCCSFIVFKGIIPGDNRPSSLSPSSLSSSLRSSFTNKLLSSVTSSTTNNHRDDSLGSFMELGTTSNSSLNFVDDHHHGIINDDSITSIELSVQDNNASSTAATDNEDSTIIIE